VVFTDTAFTVSSVIKGTDVHPGSIIQVLETGGTINGEKHNINGVSPMSKNSEHILFLDKYQGGIPNQEYVIVGAYQGRFDMTSNNQIVSADRNSKLSKINSASQLISQIQ